MNSKYMQRYSLAQVRNMAEPTGFWSRYFVHPICDPLVFMICNYTFMSPNSITLASFILSIFSGLFFIKGEIRFDVYGAIFWQLSFFCDCMDGVLARIKNKASSLGAFFDIIVDVFTLFWIPFCLLYSIVFIRKIPNEGTIFTLICLFIFFQSIPITITFLKDKLILRRINCKDIEHWLDKDTSLKYVFLKKVISVLLNRTDARVLAFFIGPISGFFAAGFFVADIILSLHTLIIFTGAIYLLRRIDNNIQSAGKGKSNFLAVEDFYGFSQSPRVSVIIPSLDGYRGGNVPKLVEDLKAQAYKDFEVNIIKNVSPQGKAINLGVDKSKGDILLILDDDSRVDNVNVIGNLVRALDKDKTIGMAGAPILVPPEANWLQKRAGSEFPRFGMKIVNKVTESDMACHGCCAIRRNVFEEVGRERENILRGLDPDLRYRMRQKGYKTVLVPDTWVYHPLPGSLGKLIKTFFRNGMGSAYCMKFQPELIYDTDEVLEMKSFQARVPFVVRVFRFPIRIFSALIEFKFLRFISYLVYAVGFYYGILKYSFRRKMV